MSGGDGLPPVDEPGMDPATLDWCAATAEALRDAHGERPVPLSVAALALHLRAAADLAYGSAKTGTPPARGGPVVHRMMVTERVCLLLAELAEADERVTAAVEAHPALRLALDGWLAVQRVRWHDGSTDPDG